MSQLTNDAGYKTTDTTYKLSKTGSTVTLTGSDGSTTSVSDSNTTYSSLKNPYSLTIQNNGTTVASYDGSTAKTANFTNATASADGLMSKADKAKLDGISSGADGVTIIEEIQWEKIYPIGSIYISANSTSPAELFGGTWEQIKDRFLLAAGDTYAAGSTGGESSHTLTVDEMPSHAHNFDDYISGYPDTSNRIGRDKFTMPLINILDPDDTVGAGQYTNAAGNSKPHNNMPPYLAVYMWQRTA